jgi:hypothetical protein
MEKLKWLIEEGNVNLNANVRVTPVYLSILSPARARPAHEPYWTGVGRDLEAHEFFLAQARPEMLFLVVLHYKIRRAARPNPARKARSDASSGMVMGRIFLARNNRNFFQPCLKPARPEKCLGLHTSSIEVSASENLQNSTSTSYPQLYSKKVQI